ncbi:hypothetical protein BKA81DRAFT_351317 [Phyllosticta paracitricarpa]
MMGRLPTCCCGWRLLWIHPWTTGQTDIQTSPNADRGQELPCRQGDASRPILATDSTCI